MKIKLKGFLNFKNEMGKHALLEMMDGRSTIRDVLDNLSNRFGEDFKRLVFDSKTKEVASYNVILVNGRHYRNLPDGLDSELKEGDEVALFPRMMVGG